MQSDFPRPRLLWLENTHNLGGGAILRPPLQKEMAAVARERGLKVHIDGARIFNAAVALKLPAAELARDADSVSFCLSKGLSCPIGSLAVGPARFIDEARRARKRLGGGMRQAGIVAACGLVALKTMVARLEEDHRHARALAEALVRVPGLAVNPGEVETNMVFVNIAGWGVTSAEAIRVLKEEGVRASEMPGPVIRLVTHRRIAFADLPLAAADHEGEPETDAHSGMPGAVPAPMTGAAPSLFRGCSSREAMPPGSNIKAPAQTYGHNWPNFQYRAQKRSGPEARAREPSDRKTPSTAPCRSTGV